MILMPMLLLLYVAHFVDTSPLLKINFFLTTEKNCWRLFVNSHKNTIFYAKGTKSELFCLADKYQSSPQPLHLVFNFYAFQKKLFSVI